MTRKRRLIPGEFIWNCGWKSNDGCRSHSSRVLRHGSAAAFLLRLRVKIPPGAWMSVSWQYCVLSGISLCVGPITRPEQSYRVWCVWVWSRNLNDGSSRPTKVVGPWKKNGTGFSPSISVFSCRYISSNVPYSFILHLLSITLATDNFIK